MASFCNNLAYSMEWTCYAVYFREQHNWKSATWAGVLDSSTPFLKRLIFYVHISICKYKMDICASVYVYDFVLTFLQFYAGMFIYFKYVYTYICESFLVLVSTIFDFLEFFSHLQLHPCRCKESPRLLVICWLQLWWVSSREASVQTWMTTKESGGTRRWSWSYGNGFFVGPCPPCPGMFQDAIPLGNM